MALEIREVDVNGQKFCITEMDFDYAEKYAEQSRLLIERSKTENVPTKEWNDRNIQVVLDAINRTHGSFYTEAELRAQCGFRGIRKLLDALLEISGFEVPRSPGEGKAA